MHRWWTGQAMYVSLKQTRARCSTSVHIHPSKLTLLYPLTQYTVWFKQAKVSRITGYRGECTLLMHRCTHHFCIAYNLLIKKISYHAKIYLCVLYESQWMSLPIWNCAFRNIICFVGVWTVKPRKAPWFRRRSFYSVEYDSPLVILRLLPLIREVEEEALSVNPDLHGCTYNSSYRSCVRKNGVY